MDHVSQKMILSAKWEIALSHGQDASVHVRSLFITVDRTTQQAEWQFHV